MDEKRAQSTASTGGDTLVTWASSLLGVIKGAEADEAVTDNPQSISLFPQFGDSKTRPMFTEFEFVSDEDETPTQVQDEIPEEINDFNQDGESGFWPESSDKDKFWMPDRLCKVCYDCEQPFNMLRRRHHCRFCGQVFCHSCSPYFIDGKSLNITGSIRACKMCNDQVESSASQQPAPRKTQMDERKDDSGSQPSFMSTGPVIPESDDRPRRNSAQDIDISGNGGDGGGAGGEGLLSLGLSVEEPGSSATLQQKSLISLTDMNLTVDFDIDDEKDQTESSNVEADIQFSGPLGPIPVGEKGVEGKDEDEVRRGSNGKDVIGLKGAAGVKRGSNPIAWAQQRMKGITKPAPLENEALAAQGNAIVNEEPFPSMLSPFVASKKFKGSRPGYDFKTGPHGTGYYPSPKPVPLLPSQAGGGHMLSEQQEPTNRNFEATPDQQKHRAALHSAAASHLNALVEDLVRGAPLLSRTEELVSSWKDIIVRLSKQVVSSVDPDVRRQGDQLDVTAYVKVKTIAGGRMEECRYVDGIVFRKQVLHKRMLQQIHSPRVLLLAGGIEFQRTAAQRMAAFDTLLEQERTYVTILVEKIVSLKPDLVLVGQAVSRAAQEYLEQHEVVVVQHVKAKLMRRIARSIGAVILSSTDHVMNRTASEYTPLGRCASFSVVAFPTPRLEDKLKRREARRLRMVDSDSSSNTSCSSSEGKRDDDDDDDDAPHLKRTRGHGYVNHVYLEGCPKDLGCTLVLRGAEKPILKEVKRIMRGAINAAYNLRLEQAYLNNRFARLPDNIFDPITLGANSRMSLTVNSGGWREAQDAESLAKKRRLLSTSLAVDFGPVRSPEVRFDSVNLMKRKPVDPLTTSAAEHQSILVTSVWMSNRVQCAPAEVKRILYYTHQDLGLGQFLLESCFNSVLKFHGERRSVLDITQMFSHHQGRLSISVFKMDKPQSLPNDDEKHREGTRMRMWGYCKKCQRVVTPVQAMSEDTWKMSFGKFLEVTFYNRAALGRTGGCEHSIQTDHILFFGLGSLAARFEYDIVRPYDIFSRRFLLLDENHRKKQLGKTFDHVKLIASELFQLFADKTHELEERAKEAGGRPEFLQLCLSELGQIQSEVHHSKVQLDRKLAEEQKQNASSSSDSSFSAAAASSAVDRASGARVLSSGSDLGEEGAGLSFTERAAFPFRFRRDLFLRASHWNERLSVVGQLVDSLQQQRNSGTATRSEEEIVADGQRRLTAIKHTHGRQVIVPPTMQSNNEFGDGDDLEEDDAVFLDVMDPQASSDSDDDLDISTSPLSATEAQHTAQLSNNETESEDLPPPYESPKKKRSTLFGMGKKLVKGKAQNEPSVNKDMLPNVIKEEPNIEEDIEEDETGLRDQVLDPSELIHDLPVKLIESSQPIVRRSVSDPTDLAMDGLSAHTDLSRSVTSSMRLGTMDSLARNTSLRTRSVVPLVGTNTASKISSTFAKLLGKDTPEEDHWKVGLGEFADGRPGLEPSSSGVVLVFEEQPTSIIAYSLSSNYYKDLLKDFMDMEVDPEVQRVDSESSLLNDPMFPPTTTNKDSIINSSSLERQMLSTHKSHIKHRFADVDDKGNTLCKFMCQSYWATQFHAVRRAFLKEDDDAGYIESLGLARQWDAQGGKSGATFLKSVCGRFVVKQITRTELQMFLDYAPAYFEYMAKNFFHGMETVLCKVVGVYTIGFQNRVTGKRYMEQVVVMQNLFHERVITRIFDLKGSGRSRYVRVDEKEVEEEETATDVKKQESSAQVLLDDNFIEFTEGQPLPLHDRAKEYFNRAVLNDTLFLSIINVVDYSILVGMDDHKKELVVGIIDYMRQYDIIKRMERMGKSVGMIAGQAEPTIIQPPAYRNRFQAAMQRYFMMVPDKWTPFHMLAVPAHSPDTLQPAVVPSSTPRPKSSEQDQEKPPTETL